MSSHSSSGHQPLRNSGSKSPSMSTIESSVTRLLVSTKHLLESLTQWARQEADDKFVSDAYVKLGNIIDNFFSSSTYNPIYIKNAPERIKHLNALGFQHIHSHVFSIFAP